jgi:hypothetical protein
MGNVPVPAKPALGPAITLAEFLEDYPLYRKCPLKWDGAPDTLSLDCWNCKKETTWGHAGNINDQHGVKVRQYVCHLCRRAAVTYVIVDIGNGSIMKVGQFPRKSIRVPHDVEKRLGASTDFYQKALTSESEGYGLGAVAYFRRVIEDKTNELIDVVADAAAAYGVEAKVVENLRAGKGERIFEDKLKIASQAMPEVLKPGGANPLQALHRILSVGIHTQTEEECLQMAKEIQDIFEYLFVRLRAEIEDRTSFVTRVKAIASKRGQRAEADDGKK